MTMIDGESELYLESCALGYAAVVQAADRRLVTTAQFDEWACTKAALHDAGIRLAAARGNLDAAERAELIALRRFRDGVVALRGEITAGGTDLDEPVDRALIAQTIDALLFFASPTKESPCPGS